jgi:isoleucyl-tRNA synthetase
MSDTEKKVYKDTLCLPQTSFAMKANLVQREPQQRKDWDKQEYISADSGEPAGQAAVCAA